MASEICLDEMKTLLELHYDTVCRKKGKKDREFKVFASAAKAYQRRLNVRLVLPQNIKDVLRSLADENRLEPFRQVLKRVIQGAETIYIYSETEAEAIARAVESGPPNEHGVEVGEGSKIPAGAHILKA